MTDDDIDTSDIPPLDDAFFERARLVLPRRYLDLLDLTKAQKFAAHILAKKWSIQRENLAHDAFNIALIVSYSRPFSMRRDIEERCESRLDQQVEIAEILDEEEIRLHERVKELRHRSYAHSDARSSLIEGLDYTKHSLFKRELNLERSEVELLMKMTEKWIKYLNEQVLLAKSRPDNRSHS